MCLYEFVRESERACMSKQKKFKKKLGNCSEKGKEPENGEFQAKLAGIGEMQPWRPYKWLFGELMHVGVFLAHP